MKRWMAVGVVAAMALVVAGVQAQTKKAPAKPAAKPAVKPAEAAASPDTLPGKPDRAEAGKLMNQGNWNEALAHFRALATDPANDAPDLPQDLTNAIQCLQNLARINEFDALVEASVAAHPNNWRLLQRAAYQYMGVEHNGFVIAGKFERGQHRGGGKWVNVFERDRTRCLQLLVQAMPLVEKEPRHDEAASFYWDFAQTLMGQRGFGGAWKLQYLTDLSKLPDWEEGYWNWYGYFGGGKGAPVHEDGTPVYYYRPKSWADAKNDGERWRYVLMQTMEMDAGRTAQVRYHFADFLHNQFGVQTMAYYGRYFGSGEDDDKDTSGTYALHTLTEEETIAKLAVGVRRFKLPDEFNFVKIYKEIGATPSGEHGLQTLSGIFANRRQYPKAADYWRENIKRFGPGQDDWKTKALDQIIGNWGMFEPIGTQAAEKGATIEFRFRNAKQVSFEAWDIDVPKLLDDVKEYLKSNPKQIEWENINIQDIGWRLVEKNQTKYLTKRVAQWDMKLAPREQHFDARVTVQTPLQQPGAYLLIGKLPDGNISRAVIWVADTAIVKKPLAEGELLYVADAVTGEPVEKANLEFFGWWQEWIEDKPIERNGKRVSGGGGHYVVHTRNFAENTDGDGMCDLKNPDQSRSWQWLITATKDKRFAFLGFTSIWTHGYHDSQYSATKAFFISDRPVYRPEQSVKWKFWVNKAQYDQDGKSQFAGRSFTIRINDPKGEKVVPDKAYKADDYGGIDGELTLPKDATLGVYSVQIVGGPGGGGSFRVEEYKKPEFEVKVQAPDEPVMLGEKITAKVEAKYLFGAPVTEAKVKYKVLRTSYSARWYPRAYWDWFYGPGYWWFAYDYVWYPGWYEWGCRRPMFVWWGGWRPPVQPELVADVETTIGKDGVVKIEIDTSVAKALHGDEDHSYEIQAEVTDLSRRTIVGGGKVLVARQPFKVYAWVNRGYYRTGDVIQASFQAQTLDNKGVKGAGELRLLKLSYQKDKETGELKPVETEVQKWNLPTGDDGTASIQMKADQPGQYRLSYKVTDAAKHTIEGGYVFTIIGQGFDGKDFRFNELELVLDKKEYAPGDKTELQVNTNRTGAAVLLFVRPSNGAYVKPKLLRIKGKSIVESIEVLKKDMPNFFVEALTVYNAKTFTQTIEVVVPPEKRVLDVKVTPLAADDSVPPASKPATIGETPVPPKATAGETPAIHEGKMPSLQNSTMPATQPAQASRTGDMPAYKPGQKAQFVIKLTDPTGEPYSGSTVVAMYDKAVEYISGGSNVPDIKEFFWKWRRHHHTQGESSLDRISHNLLKSGEIAMSFLGVFGQSQIEEVDESVDKELHELRRDRGAYLGAAGVVPVTPMPSMAPMPVMAKAANGVAREAAAQQPAAMADGGGGEAPMAEATIRKEFADTAFWAAAIQTNARGEAVIDVTMPENLTTWRTKVWAMGEGTKCGEGSLDVLTTKDLIVRLQAPRFFTQKDEVVLSANVHNYLKTAKKAQAVLELTTPLLAPLDASGKPMTAIPMPATAPKDYVHVYYRVVTSIDVAAGGEKRVDWRVKVLEPGQAVIRMKALTDEESDAMEMKFPVIVHGMLKQEAFSGVIRPDGTQAGLSVKVPAERKPEQSRLEIRYSPTLAGAMVDALPYMADYPYGCTEQTLNRFLPTVITQKVLINMGLDLKDIRDKRTNLNAQELGDDKARAKDWMYEGGYMSRGTAFKKEPVFDEAELNTMVKAGLARLLSMQCSDGGWGWFSGWGEQSYPHTTALVVHGLQIAKANDVALVPGMLERGVEWLKRYQAVELAELKLYESSGGKRGKAHADAMDAFVYMVLVDAKIDEKEMREFLYRDRLGLPVYAKSMLGIACHRVGDVEKRDMVVRNIEQFLQQDDENQTAWLRLPENNWWWCWYGSEYEAQAYYLKLLTVTDPKGDKASRLVKYLINNRKHATYWNSTRDTAVVIEAFADFMKASGEDRPDMTVRVLIDGKQVKEVKIDKSNIFSFDNKLVLAGEEVTTGEHKVQIVREGKGPVYFNAYLTNFTLEDPITKAGLEIKVQRKVYKLAPVDKTVKVEGARGEALDQKVVKYDRQELKFPIDDPKAPMAIPGLKSGDLVEVELEIESKNDYEYIMFEDMKAAGFEPVEVRSGYNGNDLGAYMELRDERVTFFVRALARGNHSVAYRLRAEIPGTFSALPTKAAAMYAPELKANSDEWKVKITD
jgi:uncharacterized protein YfaS (alpha-2-macroglobulin family)